jgi:hypothetical protein
MNIASQLQGSVASAYATAQSLDRSIIIRLSHSGITIEGIGRNQKYADSLHFTDVESYIEEENLPTALENMVKRIDQILRSKGE